MPSVNKFINYPIQQFQDFNNLSITGNTDSQKNKIQNQNQPSSRYKTELCRPFEEFATCKYGDKCQFAHGHLELRTLSRHPKYKTELCRTFHTLGLCPYGHRCHFIHNSEEEIAIYQMIIQQQQQQQPSMYVRVDSSSSSCSSSSSTSPSSNNQMRLPVFWNLSP